MATNLTDDVDIFAPDKDLLDKAVESYEENVPLVGQIAAGFTLPGMAMDLATAGKYGREGVRDIKSGLQSMGSVFSMGKAPSQLKSGVKNLGIATLAGVGAIPLFGDIAKRVGTPLIKGIEQSAEVVPTSSIIKKAKTSPPKKVKQAEDLLTASANDFEYKGVAQQKRQPIEVLDNGDGTFTQLGGSSTLEALEKSGVDHVPIKRFPNEESYKLNEPIRKAAKETKRAEDARKLQPKVNDPTFEGPVREFGSKMEKEFDKTFNLHQSGMGTVDDLFETAKKTNTQFQKEISDIADDLNLRTTNSPGEPITDPEIIKFVTKIDGRAVDSRTGHFPGTVKLPSSMLRKAKAKYNGDHTQITDGMRTRIIAETAHAADEIARKIATKYPTKDSGNQINMFGYVDRKLNIQYVDEAGNQIIAEIGIVPQAMNKAAEKAHPLYEGFRGQIALYGTPDVDLFPYAAQKRAKVLLDKQNQIFGDAKKYLDPSWLGDDLIQKFAYGGAVYANRGSSGSVSPMTPNFFSNSDLSMLAPSIVMSAYCSPEATRQESSSTGKKKAADTLASSEPAMTAGKLSQEKYKISNSMPDSIQNYTSKSIDTAIDGGRKEIL